MTTFPFVATTFIQKSLNIARLLSQVEFNFLEGKHVISLKKLLIIKRNLSINGRRVFPLIKTSSYLILKLY